MQTMGDVEGAKASLAQYFGKEANIDLYWGSAEEFLTALSVELKATGESEPSEPEKEDDDEWNF
jgi:hypothetical protein